jgi:hypothetical protein
VNRATIEARWNEFLSKQDQSALDPETVDSLRAVYYSGASDMYDLLLFGLDVIQSGEQASADHISALCAELNRFIDERQRRIN